MANEKITKAMNDSEVRKNAVEALGLNSLTKVSNTEYATMAKDLEGNDKVVVIKVTVTKAQDSIDTMVANYEAARAEVDQRKADREAERAAKKEAKEAKATKTEEVEF